MRNWFSSLIILFIVVACEDTDSRLEQFQNISKGDVYVFFDGEFYIPQRVVEVHEHQVEFHSYQFNFIKACPEESQIIDNEFDTNFVLSYEDVEIENLISTGKIVRIYSK